MEFRKATIKDLEFLAPLFLEGFYYHKKGRSDIFNQDDESKLIEDLKEALEDEDVHILMLINNNKLLGYVNYIIKKHNNLWVNELIIKEGYRNKGLGKVIMDKVFAVAREKGLTRVELNCWCFNESALGFYNHLGFKNQRIVLEKEV